MLDKRGLIEELLKLASETRANGLKSKLSPGPPTDPAAMDASEDPDMPGDPTDSASGLPTDAMASPSGGDGEPDPEMLKKLLEMLGGGGTDSGSDPGLGA